MWAEPDGVVTGTSAACATVAGVAAYILALPGIEQHIPTNLRWRGWWIRELIQKNAYARVEGGPKMVWNLARWTEPEECRRIGGGNDLQAGTSCGTCLSFL